ncbi:PAS domain-containing protein [Rubrimonas cliftonensis]|uniref:Sensory/regulatory protein RpfC n=1 Tax=Rubrimonas cliftonensis TaxID=89524 RepID=A0A1H4DH59_9RHOB|nr:PAS domain-containing protein [Rubrimonas cliftonensis]SEA72101.1 PAS domain S-box-containing protein [Rubrimonas cliftonensis]
MSPLTELDGATSEAMARFFAAASACLCVIEADGRFALANPAWETHLGWSAPRLRGVALIDLVHPADRAAMRPLACRAADRSSLVKARVQCADGGWRMMAWRRVGALERGALALSAEPAPSGLAELERLRGLGGFEIDSGAHTLRCTPMGAALLDRPSTASATPLDDALALFPPAARPELASALDDLLCAGAGFDIEAPFLTARGDERRLRLTAAPAENGALGVIEDVTAERARRDHLLRVTTAVERMAAGLMICRASGEIDWVNPAFERLNGLGLAEARARRPEAVLKGADVDALALERIAGALNACEQARVEMLVAGSGWFEIEVHPVRDGAGAIAGFVVLQTDVTEKRDAAARLGAAERAAQLASEQLRSAVEALPDGFVLFDADDRLAVCNARYRRYFPRSGPSIRVGATLEEILRYGLEHGEYAVAPGEAEAWLNNRMSLHRRPESSTEVLTAEGRWLRVVERTMPDGRRVGLRIDITEERTQRRRLEAILEGTGVGVWEADLLTGLSHCNDRYAGMLGHELEDFTPRTREGFEALVHPDDLPLVNRSLADHLAGRTPRIEHEFRMRHRNGGYVWVHSRGKLIERTADGAPWKLSGTHQDITARKRDEEALEEALRRAEQASVAKSRFLANMSHEIRTPLNGVIGMADVLARTALGADQQRMLDAIRESGDQLLSVINDILDVSKIEAGRMEIEETAFHIEELAQKLRSVHGFRAREKALTLTVETAVDAGAWLRGDPHRILQILNNLVSNALKFTEKGAVAVLVEADAAGRLVLTVADSGVGMTEQQVARIFEDFMQADSSTTRRFGGTGLGMSIVRRLVELMNGEVTVQSAPGVGTTVRISLALAPASGLPPAARPDAPRASVAGLRVLAADDNEINRMVLEAMLEELAVDVTIVDGGVAAVHEAGRGDYDALLLDISMPDVDGVAALKRIRAEEKKRGAPPVPAIAVTANALTHQTDLYIAEGFDRCVAKPIRPGDLAGALAATARRPAPG